MKRERIEPIPEVVSLHTEAQREIGRRALEFVRRPIRAVASFVSDLCVAVAYEPEQQDEF